MSPHSSSPTTTVLLAVLACIAYSSSTPAATAAPHPIDAHKIQFGSHTPPLQTLATPTGRSSPTSSAARRRSTRQSPGRQSARVSIRLSRSRPPSRRASSRTTVSGARGYDSNGTKLSGESCAALFVGDDCQEPVRVPDCMSGVFQAQYWVLNRQHFIDTNTSNMLPLKRGFRGVVPDVFQKVLAALPAEDVFSSGHPAGRCALVGSDRSLRQSSFGHQIDEFDVVVRMNGAPTKGYESHVGSKTTHRFVNNAYVGWREGNETVVSKWHGSVKQVLQYAQSHTWVINPKFLEYSQSRRFTSHHHLCTQGFRALLILMHTCREVHVFGFDGGTGWYYDKRTNRLEEDKALHRGSLPGVAGASLQQMVAGEPLDDEGDDEGKAEILGDEAGGADRGSATKDAAEEQGLALHMAVVGNDLRRRRLFGTPGGHKIKVERSCMRRLVAAGIIRHHPGKAVPE